MEQNNIATAQVVKKIAEEFGISDLPEEKQEELIAKMTETLLKRIFVDTMEKLGDEGMKKYEELLNREADPKEVETFIRSKIIDYNDFVEVIVNDFKAQMLGVAKK